MDLIVYMSKYKSTTLQYKTKNYKLHKLFFFLSCSGTRANSSLYQIATPNPRWNINSLCRGGIYNSLALLQHLFLSHLEVERLDTVSKHEGEECCEANQDYSNWCHEIWIIPKMVFYVLLDRKARVRRRIVDGLLNITVLWHNQSVYCPCHGANPVVPHPPLGNFLKNSTCKELAREVLLSIQCSLVKRAACRKKRLVDAYRSWDKETREQVEDTIEGWCKDSCYLMVWCDWNGHHSIVCEVQEWEEWDEEEPEEFCSCPLKAHHGIHYQCVINCLNEHVRYFNYYLHDHMIKPSQSRFRIT